MLKPAPCVFSKNPRSGPPVLHLGRAVSHTSRSQRLNNRTHSAYILDEAQLADGAAAAQMFMPPSNNSHFRLEHTVVKKLQKMSADKKSTAHRSGAVKESAQQIWLAGLGAFSKAQEGGGKVFEALMKEGLSIQRKTQATAEEKISEATSKMANLAGDIQSKAGHQWDKLETIFEDRVAKALNKLGVPSAKDVEALLARIEALHQSVQKMGSKAPVVRAPAAKKATPARRAAGAKAVPANAKTVILKAASKDA